MISFILGLMLLITPFLVVVLFKDKKIGFIFVLFCSILFHVILALATQMLGIFYYGIIIGVIFVADLILFFFFLKK